MLSAIERVQLCHQEQQNRNGKQCLVDGCTGCKYEVLDPLIFRAYVQGYDDAMKKYAERDRLG
jgi:hypothetical protein